MIDTVWSNIIPGLLLLLLLAALISFGLAYLAERYTTRALQSYVQFQNARQKLATFEEKLDEEATNWPIYARPVLFKSVDKSTQRTFGVAQLALMESRRIVEEFPSIPVRPDKVWEAFFPIQCLQRIAHCDAVIQREAELNKWLNQLQEEKEELGQHASEQDQTLERVEGKLHTLNERLSTAEKTVAAKTHGEAFNETIGWVINYAQIGAHASSEKLNMPREKGHLNYAIADTFIRLTNYLLDHFDLSATDVSLSDKFILDRFENRLKDFEINLRKVIEAKPQGTEERPPVKEVSSPATVVQQPIAGLGTKFTAPTVLQMRQATYQQATNAIETWDDVAFLDSHLTVLKEKLERASYSFSFFQNTRTIYLGLMQRIMKLNMSQLQEESLKLETECELYWGAFAAFPTHWKEALHGSSLPSLEFSAAMQLYISRIHDSIKPGTKIRQSEITPIISRMTCYLAIADNGKASYKKLFQHLKFHKDAEVIVLERLGDHGSTGKLIHSIEVIKNDYSEPNRRTCLLYHEEYNDFVARARKITGANFPAMRSELDGFEGKCSSLLAMHRQEIKDLHQKCEKSCAWLRSQSSAILQFKSAVPRIKYDFPTIEAKIQSTIQKDYLKSANVQWLENYLKEAGRVKDDADRAVSQLKAAWKEFEDAEQNASAMLAHHRALLSKYQTDFLVSWAWVKADSAGLLENTRTKLEQLSLPLSKNRDPHLKTSVEDAIRNCQKVVEQIKALNSTTLGKLTEIHQQQEDFKKSFDALMNMIDRPIAPIEYIIRSKPKVPAKIRELCFLATQVREKGQVRSLLNAADAYFQKQLTEEQAEKLIQEVHYHSEVSIKDSQIQGNSVTIAGRDINTQGDKK